MSIVLTSFPADDWKVIAICWPREIILSFTQFLELHSQLTLAHFVLGENLERYGYSQMQIKTQTSNEPLNVKQDPFSNIPR